MNKWKKGSLFLVVITITTILLAGKKLLVRNTEGSLHLQLHTSGTRSEKGANESLKSTYVLSISYSGQQGAGLRGVLSLQCFASNLGIPVYIVEPFISSSKVGLERLPRDLGRALKFSDFIDLDRFNLASAMQKYPNLSRWEMFLKNGPNKVVVVQFKKRGLKQTKVLWRAYGSQCYRGNFLRKLHLPKEFPCVVRIVSICCVVDDRNSKINPTHAASMEAIYNSVFGNWKPGEVTLLFKEWVTRWYVPGNNRLDCKAIYQNYIPGRFSPSQQLLSHAKRYMKLFLHSRNITAVMLRFEHMLLKIMTENTPETVESCLKEIKATVKQMNTNIFVSADIGKYGSNTWWSTFSHVLKFSSKRASETMGAFKRTLFGLVKNVKMWENSFAQATGRIVDKGYIAALQKTLASTAECIVLVGGGNFQNIVLQEYIDNHPDPSKQCIYNICVKKKQAEVYENYIQQTNFSSIEKELEDELESL